jgi:hypothetical protein
MAKASLSTPNSPVQRTRQIQRCPKSSLVLEHESQGVNGRAVWFARVPADHTMEDVCTNDYFGQLQLQYGGLKAGDVIDVEPETGLWMTRLRVMAVVPALQQVKTRELHGFRHEFAVEPPAGYRFEWRGGEVRWSIVRNEDGVTLDGGFDTQDEAYARLEIISGGAQAA